MFLKDQMSSYFPKHFLGVFHDFSHHGQSPIFLAPVLLSNQYLKLTIRCVLRAIDERYEAIYDVCMYVCMSLKVSVNYRQTVRDFSS